MRTRVPYACLLALAYAPGCNAVWGLEKGDLGDACRSPLCVTIDAAKAHPPYDAASGAASLGLDGAGVLHISVFVVDPMTSGDAPFATKVLPESGELSLDQLPKTVGFDLAPGNYWIMARFEDRKAKYPDEPFDREVGDFVSIFAAKTSVTTGAPGKASMTLQPARAIEMGLSADPKMSVDYKDFQVNGDGYWYVEMFDDASEIDFGGGNCIALSPMSATPPTVNVQWNSAAMPGRHKLFVYVDDLGTLSGTSKTTLPPGTLVSADGPTAPSVTIPENTWRTKISVPIVKVLDPVKPGTPDTLHCP